MRLYRGFIQSFPQTPLAQIPVHCVNNIIVHVLKECIRVVVGRFCSTFKLYPALIYPMFCLSYVPRTLRVIVTRCSGVRRPILHSGQRDHAEHHFREDH